MSNAPYDKLYDRSPNPWGSPYSPMVHPSQDPEQDGRARSSSSGTGGVNGKSEGLSLGTNSIMNAVFAFACSTIGAGIVALPGALQSGGWLAVILVVLVAVCANYTAKLLINCMSMVPGRYLHSYADIGEAVYGTRGRRLVQVFQVTTLFGVCTIFLILAGGNMSALVDKLTLHDWVFIFGAVLIPISWLKTIKEIAPLAYFGIASSIYVGFVVIIKGIVRHANHDEPHAAYDVFKAGGISVAFNVVVFSFGGHSVLPTIAVSMKEPRKFPLMANIAYTIIGTVYATVAFFGYLGWGGVALKDSGGSALKALNPDSGWTKSAQALITAHVIMAYPIPMAPLNRYFEAWLGIDKMEGQRELFYRCTLRTFIVLTTVFIASVVPYFGDMLSLVSALSIVAVVFVFPCLFYWELRTRFPTKNERGEIIPISKTRLAFMAFNIVLGVVGTIAGVYYGIKDLQHDIKTEPNPFENFFKPAHKH